MAIKQNLREALAPFFESPDRELFREILRGNTGEFNHIDFKEIWIECPKLAKHILGMANNRGGAIIFGVSEDSVNGATPIGLAQIKDKTPVKNKLSKYIPEQLGYEILDFAYNDSDWGILKGRTFQLVVVDDTPERIPFLSMSDGKGIGRNKIYYRGNTNTEEATYEQIQEILSRRVDTQHSITAEEIFKNDLYQLKELYTQIPRTRTNSKSFAAIIAAMGNPFSLETEDNPDYPEESFTDFINRMIILKKRIIENAVKNREFNP